MNKRGTSRPQRHTLCRQHQDRRPPARARPGGVLLLRRSRSLAAGHGRHRARPRPLARRDGGEARAAGLPGELRQKSVVFALNDLSQVKPPAAALAPGDQFIGPVFDESAIRFFLVFNANLKSSLHPRRNGQNRRRCADCSDALHGIPQPKGPCDLRSLRDQSADCGGAGRRMFRACAGRRPWRQRAAAGDAASRPMTCAHALRKRAGGLHRRPANSNAGGAPTTFSIDDTYDTATELVEPTQLRRLHGLAPLH